MDFNVYSPDVRVLTCDAIPSKDLLAFRTNFPNLSVLHIKKHTHDHYEQEYDSIFLLNKLHMLRLQKSSDIIRNCLVNSTKCLMLFNLDKFDNDIRTSLVSAVPNIEVLIILDCIDTDTLYEMINFCFSGKPLSCDTYKASIASPVWPVLEFATSKGSVHISNDIYAYRISNQIIYNLCERLSVNLYTYSIQ